MTYGEVRNLISRTPGKWVCCDTVCSPEGDKLDFSPDRLSLQKTHIRFIIFGF